MHIFFCFAHLRLYHNGWASNTLSGGCRRSLYPPQLNIGCPSIMSYDQHHRRWAKPKISSLFSCLVRIVLPVFFFFSFYWRDLFVKNIITSFHWFHLNNYTPYENKCCNPINQIHRVAFATYVNSVCVRMLTQCALFTRVKYATTPCNCWTHCPPCYSNG